MGDALSHWQKYISYMSPSSLLLRFVIFTITHTTELPTDSSPSERMTFAAYVNSVGSREGKQVVNSTAEVQASCAVRLLDVMMDGLNLDNATAAQLSAGRSAGDNLCCDSRIVKLAEKVPESKTCILER